LDASTGAVLHSVSVGGRPYQAAYDGLDHRVYVTINETNDLAALNVTSGHIVKRITVGSAPNCPRFDLKDGTIYVSTTGKVVLVKYLRVVGDVVISAKLSGIAYDSSSSDIYVETWMTGMVYAISA
jgi:YD repeat-containing protein